MIEIFPWAQWLAVGLAGFFFGMLTLHYLIRRPRLFVLSSGLIFFVVRIPSELEHVERVIGAALLWVFFTLSMAAGQAIIHRKYE